MPASSASARRTPPGTLVPETVAIQIEMMPNDRLFPCIRNAWTRLADRMVQIAASIAEFGSTNPIMIGADEVIITGHDCHAASAGRTPPPNLPYRVSYAAFVVSGHSPVR